jgi:hypothetical protein
MRTLYFFVLIISLVLFIPLGCQKKQADNPEFRYVTGTVTLDNAPLKGATVTFFPLEPSGMSASGYTDAQGKYTLTALESFTIGKGTKPGKYRVTVVKNETVINTDMDDLNAGRITYNEYMERQNKPTKPKKNKSIVPVIYTDQAQSPIVVTIEDKKNVFDLDFKK